MELGNLWARGRPNIDWLGESYSKEIIVAPVNKVQIKIISQLGSIQNLVRNLWNFSSFLLRKYLVFAICNPLERVFLEAWHWRTAIKHLDIWPRHCLEIILLLAGILVNLQRTTTYRNIRTLNYTFLLSHVLCLGCREYAFPEDLIIDFQIQELLRFHSVTGMLAFLLARRLLSRFICTIKLQYCEFGTKWRGILHISSITQKNALWWRGITKCSWTHQVLDIILGLRWGISKAIAIGLPLHLGIQILLEMVLVSVVDLVEELLVLKAKNVVLKQGHVGSLVLDFLQGLLLLQVVTHQVVVFSLLLLQLMVNLENFDFCIVILGDFVLVASEIYKTISFY